MKSQLTRAAIWELNIRLKRMVERLERNKADRDAYGIGPAMHELPAITAENERKRQKNIERENDRLAALVQDAMHERAA